MGAVAVKAEVDPGKQLAVAKPSGAFAWVDSLRPKNLAEAMELCKVLASSDVVPKDFQGKPGNVLVAIGMGGEVGLSPFQSIQNIMVVNGRPTMWGDALLGLVEASSKVEFYEEAGLEEIQKTGKAWARSQRKGQARIVDEKFSLDDAKKAGYLGKQGPWQTVPHRMLQCRARAFCLRNLYPDVLKGIRMREEVEDYQEPTAIPEPRRASDKHAIPAHATVVEESVNPAIAESAPQVPAEAAKEGGCETATVTVTIKRVAKTLIDNAIWFIIRNEEQETPFLTQDEDVAKRARAIIGAQATVVCKLPVSKYGHEVISLEAAAK